MSWNRERRLDYIRSGLGVTWRESACVFCPFNILRDDAIERHREHPAEVADAMTIEHMSLALNPRGTLYKGRSLIEITRAACNQAVFDHYQKSLEPERWALYRVRRISSQKRKADRAVEKLAVLANQASARQAPSARSRELGVAVEEQRGILYAWRERRNGAVFPTREEFLTIGRVNSKARYGLAWFERKWAAVQLRLF